MTAEDRAGVYYFALRCLLRIFDAEAAQRLSIEVRGLSREDLAALIEGSTRDIPTAEHRRLLQEASDFVRWGRRGGVALCGRLYFLLLARFRWAASN